MPASTLPTRSAPTSAPLVKMPPPRRAKIEISDAPNDRPTSASRIARCSTPSAEQDAVVEGDAEQAQGDDEHAGDRPGLEGDVEAAGEAAGRGGLGCAGVGAHRDVHADEAGCGGQAGADGVADADLEPEEEGEEHEDDHANHGDGRVLAAEVGGGTLLDGRRDLLHPLVAGGHCEDAGARANRPDDARGAAGEHQHVEKPLQTRHGHLPLLVARQDQLWRARESALHTLSSSLLGPRPAPL